jgi:tetratricopeptide (TPR) repeat protein
MALLEADRPDEALAEAKATVACSPQNGHAHCALAAVYLGTDDGAAALAAIERAAACFAAQHEPVHRLIVARCAGIRGAALSMLGRHDEAMLAFDELLRLEPDFFERWPELAAPYELSRRETKGGS